MMRAVSEILAMGSTCSVVLCSGGCIESLDNYWFPTFLCRRISQGI